jgi:hypothetical protein
MSAHHLLARPFFDAAVGYFVDELSGARLPRREEWVGFWGLLARRFAR